MWWVDCVYMLSASCDYVQQKIDDHSPGITAQKAYRKKWLGGGGCAQKAPLFQAMFRIIDSKYLLLGLIYLMGVGLHNLCTEHRNLVGYLLTDQLKKLAHHPILAKFKPCKEYQDSFSLCYFLLLK